MKHSSKEIVESIFRVRIVMLTHIIAMELTISLITIVVFGQDVTEFNNLELRFLE